MSGYASLNQIMSGSRDTTTPAALLIKPRPLAPQLPQIAKLQHQKNTLEATMRMSVPANYSITRNTHPTPHGTRTDRVLRVEQNQECPYCEIPKQDRIV